jgi:peptide/nickel transport system substrate-binding protein
MRRLVATGTTVAVAALVLASAGGTHTIKEGGTFRVGMSAASFDSIDPELAEFATPSEIFYATCASLLNIADSSVSVTSGLRLIPEIAADFPTVSRDGRTYTFTIRAGFRFNTGAQLRARDVAASLNRVLSPKLNSPGAERFRLVEGSQAVREGRATIASGVTARRDELIVRLTRRDAGFLLAIGRMCVFPSNLAVTDGEGVRAPVPSAGPYFVSEYVAGERVVLERNPHYGGRRPNHVNRFFVTLESDAGLVDRVERGELDYAFVTNTVIGPRAPELVRKYGRNKERFWVQPGAFLRMFVLNTSRPLFRNNVKLRQAVNFAVDRTALQRERGGSLAGTVTDQYLAPIKLGFSNERLYPLKGPNLDTARALARGRQRSGKAVLYTSSSLPGPIAQAQILRDNLRKIGLGVQIQAYPFPVLVEKLQTPGEPFDIGFIGWGFSDPDPVRFLRFLFDGRTIRNAPDFGNFSYFNSPRYNRLLDRAARLPAQQRYRAYGELDAQISRDAAPAIPYSYDNALTLVGARTGCVVVNPTLDLAAVCLK